MKNNILNKRTYWEASYDKLKLQTDQNKELVKHIVERLIDQNNSLLQSLKDMVYFAEGGNTYKAETINRQLIALAKEAIKKAEQ